jgi:hypothetical protein
VGVVWAANSDGSAVSNTPESHSSSWIKGVGAIERSEPGFGSFGNRRWGVV